MTRTTRTIRNGGRPTKFNEPSRPVTVTLPLRTLRQLQSIDEDRAKAIAKAVDAVIGDRNNSSMQIEMVEMSAGARLLVVPSNQSLRTIPWLKMIEVAPTRNLLTISPGTSIEKLEIALIDLIEEARTSLPHEVPMLESLREKFGRMRRESLFHKAEILLVDEQP